LSKTTGRELFLGPMITKALATDPLPAAAGIAAIAIL